MTARRLSVVTAIAALVLALAGAAVAGYLAIENLRGDTGVCVGVHGCATVQNSRYGELLGIPVSVPGFALYVVLAATAAVYLGGRFAGAPEVAFVGFLGAVGGLLVSVYLTYVEAAVLDAWCSYCIVSAVLMAGLFALWGLLLFLELRAEPGEPARQGGASSSRNASSSRIRS